MERSRVRVSAPAPRSRLRGSLPHGHGAATTAGDRGVCDVDEAGAGKRGAAEQHAEQHAPAIHEGELDRPLERPDPQTLRHVLRHELAHANQRDARGRGLFALAQIPFFIGFYYYIGPKSAWLLAGLVGFSWLYNSRRFGLRNFPVLDLLNQSGYLVVFVLSSWLNGVPQLGWPVFVFGALFAMHSHLLLSLIHI